MQGERMTTFEPRSTEWNVGLADAPLVTGRTSGLNLATIHPNSMRVSIYAGGNWDVELAGMKGNRYLRVHVGTSTMYPDAPGWISTYVADLIAASGME